jgi:hypothetical protein
MDKVAMREKFSKRAAGLANDLDSAGIDLYLDAAFQYGVAAEVSGSLVEGIWEFDTVASQDYIDYESHVYEVRKGCRRAGTLISEYRRVEVFKNEQDQDASEGAPQAVLFYGRQAIFAPVPDAVYAITVPARLYPEEGLTSAGLENHNHAMAVICEAIVELAEDFSKDPLKQRAEASLAKYLRRLRGPSNSRTKERAGGLSF